MKILAASLTLASLLAAGAAHADRSQLIAHLKLKPEQAATMSLSEIAALKFNSDSDSDNQQSVTAATPAGAGAHIPVWYDGDDH
jgi:hypothetical protein